MKCVCRVRCQVRVDGKIITFRKGDVFEFDECPVHFEPIAGETPEAKEIDFLTATEEELLEAKWKFSDAAEAIKAAYDVDLKKKDKEDVVSQILDARYRYVDPNQVS